MGLEDNLLKLRATLAHKIAPKVKQRGNKKIEVLIDEMNQRRSIWRKEITDWQLGRQAFYDDYVPTTFDLQEVYHDVMLDDQLTTVTEDRILRTLNKPLIVLNAAGKEDDEKTALLNDQEWLFDFIRQSLQSIFYGYTLTHLRTGKSLTGKVYIKEPYVVPRGFISHCNSLILKNEYTPTVGVEWEKYPNELIYSQFYDAAGLLEKASPLTIIKRHSWASWDEFEQIFGIPIRVAKYAMGNDKVKEEIAGWLQEMGSSAYGVFPKETEIDIIENQKSDAFNVFLQKISRVDQGLSKLILHQTGTTDEKAFVGAAEVHSNTLDMVIAADQRKLKMILNHKLLPALRHWGYNLGEGDVIDFKQTINPSSQIEIDSKIMKQGVTLKKEYLERVYGVEIDDTVEKKEVNTAAQKKKALDS